MQEPKKPHSNGEICVRKVGAKIISNKFASQEFSEIFFSLRNKQKKMENFRYEILDFILGSFLKVLVLFILLNFGDI